MTNVMTRLPSASCACGQPWEAHELRCPRQKRRGVGKVVALAVASGVAAQVLFVAAVVSALGLISSHRETIGRPIRHIVVTGPVQPRVQACELFYGWEMTHNPSLLKRAVADARSPRVPLQVKPLFRAFFSGLLRSTRDGAHSSKAFSYEHAVQWVCQRQIRAGVGSRH